MQSSGNWNLFNPPRRRGLLVNLGAMLLCTTIAALLLSLAVGQQAGLPAILLLVGALLFAMPIPLFLYRLYGLIQSAYWVGRDGLRLRWGLRLIDLPYAEILDVARAEELADALTPPSWSWPGSVVGQVEHEGLGSVEFIASEADRLVLLGTSEGVYAISPEEPQLFVEAYKRQSERGSLRPIVARSIAPSFVLAEAWEQPKVRRLLAAGATAAMLLLILVAVLAPGRPSVSLGFAADGSPMPAVAGVQLFLLPALNLFFFMGSFILGLLLYREAQGPQLSLLVWGSSLVTSALFLVAIVTSLFLPT